MRNLVIPNQAAKGMSVRHSKLGGVLRGAEESLRAHRKKLWEFGKGRSVEKERKKRCLS